MERGFLGCCLMVGMGKENVGFGRWNWCGFEIEVMLYGNYSLGGVCVDV